MKNNDLMPREKMMKNGSRSLSDTELLAILLSTGTKEKNVFELSEELLEKADHKLSNLCEFGVQILNGVTGIKTAKSTKLLAAFEIARRVEIEKTKKEMECFNNPSVAGKYLVNTIGNLDTEHFCVLILNTKNNPVNKLTKSLSKKDSLCSDEERLFNIKDDYEKFYGLVDDELVFMGTLDSIYVSPREVFRKSIKLNASSIIIAHNHPSESVNPSPQDLKTTSVLIKAGKILGIKVLDHFVVSKYDYYSLRENGDLANEW